MRFAAGRVVLRIRRLAPLAVRFLASAGLCNVSDFLAMAAGAKCLGIMTAGAPIARIKFLQRSSGGLD